MTPYNSPEQRRGRARRLGRFSGSAGPTAARLISSFARNERGGIFIFVALAIIPLIAFVGLAVDTTRGYLVKSRLSSAVDAAALAGGRVFTSATRDADVQMFFSANFPDGYMGAVTEPISIEPDAVNKKLVVSAEAVIPTSFMHLIGIDSIPVAASAEVLIESQNVEVALVLDITQSMSGDIGNLRSAANSLVDLVVQDDQTLFYTKVALVPYSHAVNVTSTYANTVRGTPPSPKGITGITKANPAVITSTNHGFNTGDKVFISGVGGLTAANNDMTALANATKPNFWVVQKVDANKFSLKKCNDDNDACTTTTAVSSSSWSGTYTANSGSIYCMTVGCTYLAFQQYTTSSSTNNRWLTWQINNCVTERYAANVDKDVPPTTTTVGPRYQPSGATSANTCAMPAIQPLTSSKSTLHSKINALTVTGSTAGQIGIAWGWYMLSPTFDLLAPSTHLWPSGSQPAAYGTPKLMKVAILMTDGEFNTIYKNGVIAKDADYDSTTRASQNAANGNPYTQALNMCAAMKTKGIVIYTVGFNVNSLDPAVTNLLSTCAKGPSYVYLPDDGSDLEDAFKDIAMKISKLRLTK